jgi:3-oxoacyl-[acyl-carrier protein] reductase
MRDLAGRTAIVTGASRGIGIHVARALARERMNLVLAARSTSDLEAVAAQLRMAGADVIAAPTDVADPSALQALILAAKRAFGEPDVVVSGAGIATVGAHQERDLEGSPTREVGPGADHRVQAETGRSRRL